LIPDLRVFHLKILDGYGIINIIEVGMEDGRRVATAQIDME